MRALGASRTSVVPGGALAAGWTRNALWKTARAVPSLDLRFADNKSLGDAVGGGSLVTVTRDSSGTYVGSDGLLKTAATNEPRFDHNPTTGESLGLLVEEARTNLVLRSEEFNDASWTKQSSVSVSANTTISPDGNLTADTITADQSLGIFQNVAATVSTTYTNSVYIKAGTATAMMLRDDTGAGRHIVFNPSTGVITATSGTLVSSGSQALNNGWYRYFMTYVADATTVRGLIRPNSAGSAQTFIAWGAQLEIGAFATSYIPTTTATVTRAADVASITGSNFSSWYNQTEGTVYFKGSSLRSSGSPATRSFQFEDGTSANNIRTSGTATLQVISTTTTQCNLTSTPNIVLDGSLYDFASAYKVDDFATSTGSAASVDTTGTIPAVDRLVLGGGTSAGILNGTISRFTYWPTRLSNTTLQQITQ